MWGIPSDDRGERSAIEWTEATWNPVTGCSKISPGCAHCYAERLSLRFSFSQEPWTAANAVANVRLHPERLELPLRWRRPRMIFVNSMSDLFHELVPDEFIAEVFATIARAEQHTFQLLTKRHERLAELAAALEWPPNLWMGVSIENARWSCRADVLRQLPAAPERFDWQHSGTSRASSRLLPRTVAPAGRRAGRRRPA